MVTVGIANMPHKWELLKFLVLIVVKKMIAKAVADNSDDKIKYKVCGVEEYIYPENTYDLVVSNLVLHYIENLANVYQKVYCTLKVGGYFLFNIEHPTFTAGVNEDWIYDENGKPKYWPIDNYYYTGERETNFSWSTSN